MTTTLGKGAASALIVMMSLAAVGCGGGGGGEKAANNTESPSTNAPPSPFTPPTKAPETPASPPKSEPSPAPAEPQTPAEPPKNEPSPSPAEPVESEAPAAQEPQAPQSPSNGPGTAVLSWELPSNDSETLGLLAGFRIHYGVDQNVLTETIEVRNPGVSTYVVDNLPPGKYFFAVRTVTSTGDQSALSNVIAQVVR
jgi:hypothetical protein